MDTHKRPPRGTIQERKALVQAAFQHSRVRDAFLNPCQPHPAAFVADMQLSRLRRITRQLPLAASLRNISSFRNFADVFQVRQAEPATFPSPSRVLSSETLTRRWMLQPMNAKEAFAKMVRGEAIIRKRTPKIELEEGTINLSRLNDLRLYPTGIGQLHLIRDLMLVTGDCLPPQWLISTLKKMGSRLSSRDLQWKTIPTSYHGALFALRLLMEHAYQGEQGYIDFYNHLHQGSVPVSKATAFQIASALDPRGGPKVRNWEKKIVASSPQEERDALDLLTTKPYLTPNGREAFRADMHDKGYKLTKQRADILCSALTPQNGPRLRGWGKQIIAREAEETYARQLLRTKKYIGTAGRDEFHQDMWDAGYRNSKRKNYVLASALSSDNPPETRGWGPVIHTTHAEEESLVREVLSQVFPIGAPGFDAYYEGLRVRGLDLTKSQAYDLAVTLDPQGGPKARSWPSKNVSSCIPEERKAIELLKAKKYPGNPGCNRFVQDMIKAGYPYTRRKAIQICHALDPQGGPITRGWVKGNGKKTSPAQL